MNKLVLAAILLLCVNYSYAQKQIRLTNQKNHKTRFLKEGHRIAYVTHGDFKVNKGILKTVGEDFIVVDDKTVNYSDLSQIGRKRSGSGFLQLIVIAMGVRFIIASVIPPPDPCPSCQQVGSNDNTGATVGGVAIGGAFIGLGVLVAANNSTKDLTKWKMEAVDVQTKK